jgi:hypothetical protein
MMLAHIRYLWYVLRHKYYVYIAGRTLGLSRRQLLAHDLSKFGRAEWTSYVQRFYGGRGSRWDMSEDTQAFRDAWEHHWRHNRHHWQFWALREPPLPMPKRYAKEMAADLYGAGMAQDKPDILEWYQMYGPKMELYPQSREWLEQALDHLMQARAKGILP